MTATKAGRPSRAALTPAARMPDVERVRRLRAMAAQWDRCAANAPGSTSLRTGQASTYSGWAQVCRDKADQLEGATSRPGQRSPWATLPDAPKADR